MWMASDGPAADGSWAAREELAGRATQEERHTRGARKKGRGLFWGKIGGVFACPPGGVEVGAQLSRPWVQACRRKTPRAVATLGGNPACGGLWPFQLIQLIHLRYLCGSAEREKRMDVCFLLTLYIQYIIKFGGCQKWKVEENGRDGKIWKARDCGRWICEKVCVGRNGREVRWLPPKVPFLTFLRFYDILTVFSRESRKRGTENVCIR